MDNDRFEEAVEWARPFLRNAVLRQSGQTARDHAAAMMPRDDSEAEALQFKLTIDALIARADRHPFSFDVLAACVAACQRDGRHMPTTLGAFASEVKNGARRRPQRRGPDPARPQQQALGLIMRFVANKYGFDRYNNNDEGVGHVTAANVVLEALQREGHHMRSLAAIVKAYQRLPEDIR